MIFTIVFAFLCIPLCKWWNIRTDKESPELFVTVLSMMTIGMVIDIIVFS